MLRSLTLNLLNPDFGPEETVVSIEPSLIKKQLEKLKQCQQDVVHTRLTQILKTQAIQEQKPAIQEQLKKWKVIQHVRFVQQILYLGASAATFGTFIPNTNANLINGIVDTSMAFANFIPLLLDKLDACKFYRNVPVDIPSPEITKVDEKVARYHQRLDVSSTPSIDEQVS